MAINYNKYINSTGTHYISNSGGDERGKITGGAAGDQTGKEWQLRSWYNRPWSCILRHPNPEVRRLIAELGIEGALNDLIGYDQNQRGTFWQQLKVSGYRPANIKTKCEADCSAGANSIVKAVGYLLNIQKLKEVSSANSSRNTKEGLKAAGFEVLSASKYRTGYKYLLPGDILLYINHHVAINITRGSKADGEVAGSVNTDTPNSPASPDSSTTGYTLGDRILKNGMSGADVKELQTALIKLGYSCGSYGCDGDYGDATELAVMDFQLDHKPLDVDGEAGPETIAALKAALKEQEVETGYHVRIYGGKCNIRTAPNTDAKVLGVAKEGELYPYGGEKSPDGWLLIEYKSLNAWVSGKYGRLV